MQLNRAPGACGLARIPDLSLVQHFAPRSVKSHIRQCTKILISGTHVVEELHGHLEPRLLHTLRYITNPEARWLGVIGRSHLRLS